MDPINPDAPAEHAIVLALRLDLAHQITRHLKRLGNSQVEYSRSLGIPQPTLSKIVNRRVSDLSIELLIRIAVRAKLSLVLQTGEVPEEAGAFITGRSGIDSGTVSSPSSNASRNSLMESGRQLTPAQRLEAFLQHNQFIGELFQAGRSVESARGLLMPKAQ